MIKAALILVFATVQAIPKEGFLHGHVITGEEAGDSQFPFLASIRINSVHHCAGSIVNERWILTAAQCRIDAPIDAYTVVCGTTKLNGGGVTYQVQNFFLHENYDPTTKVNDIALIETSKSIIYTPKIQPVQLPEANIADNEYLIASGWGYTSSPGTTPNDLMWIYMRTFNLHSCQNKYKIGRVVEKGNLCTYGKKGYTVCSGDVGGPLTANGIVYGVATWSVPCSLDGQPDVFTRVFYYRKWIDNVIKG